MTQEQLHIGTVILSRRRELGLTQEELCARMGFKPERITYISAVENGQYADLKLSRLELFAQALDISAADLLQMRSRNRSAA